jgi:hypothetical protein
VSDKWSRHGIGPEEEALWKAFGFGIRAALGWHRLSLTPQEAARLTSIDMSLDSATALHKSGLNRFQIVRRAEVAHAGLTMAEASEWTRAGFPLGSAVAWVALD